MAAQLAASQEGLSSVSKLKLSARNSVEVLWLGFKSSLPIFFNYMVHFNSRFSVLRSMKDEKFTYSYQYFNVYIQC
jgi:hypothetical protein